MKRFLSILLASVCCLWSTCAVKAEKPIATSTVKIILTKKRSVTTRPERIPEADSPISCQRDGKYILISGDLDAKAYACVANINTASHWGREFTFPTPCTMITTDGDSGEYSIAIIADDTEYEGFFTID